MRIAYLINVYPKISHSFIRREILALEHQGFEVQRIALQGWDSALVDEADWSERTRTRYVLREGMLPILWAVFRTLLLAPTKFLSAVILAIRVGWRSQRPLPFHFFYLAEACRILPWVKSFGATHVHAHFGTNSAEIAMLVHVLGGPTYSFTVHGQDELLFGGLTEKLRRAAFIVAIGSFGRGQIFRRVAYSLWPKVRVVHTGLEVGFYSIEAVPPPISARLVCVGRLGAEKGQLLLVEAANRLIQKGVEFDLVLAGDGEMRPEVEALIERLGLSNHVRITGWLTGKQVRDEILAARALVLPSFTEGLPVVAVEAMALRRPVLATYVGGVPELVEPGTTGWLVPAGSLDELTSAMENCLSTGPDELRRMGEAGFRRVLQRHSIDSETDKLAGFFRDICESPEPR